LTAGVTGKRVFHADFGLNIPKSGVPRDQNPSYGSDPSISKRTKCFGESIHEQNPKASEKIKYIL
jgi:hypothetical protein